MNVTGCLQHNVIAIFVVVLAAFLTGNNPVVMLGVALITGAGFAVREAGQRRKDFPGISWQWAFRLNWTGPKYPDYREIDRGRSAWDWRVQGYAPTVFALGAAFVLTL